MNKKIIAILIISILCFGLVSAGTITAIGTNEKNSNVRENIEIEYKDGTEIIKHPSGLEITVTVQELKEQRAELIIQRDGIIQQITDLDKKILDVNATKPIEVIK